MRTRPAAAKISSTFEQWSKKVLDSWTSALNTLGQYRDRRKQRIPTTDFLSRSDLVNLWRSNSLAAKAVEVWPKEMLREGFQIKIPGETGLKEDIEGRWDDLNLVDKLKFCLFSKRAYGGSALLPGLEDGSGSLSNLAQPLVFENVRKVRWLASLEDLELTPLTWFKGPQALGEMNTVETWNLQPDSRAKLPIHSTRLHAFIGVRVSNQQNMGGVRSGWGDSVLVRPYETIRDFGLTWDATVLLIEGFAQRILKIKDLAQIIAKDKDDLFKKRMLAIEMSRALSGLTLLDKEEDMEALQTPLEGIPDVIVLLMQRIAGDLDMPMTRLWGTSPAGMNATGESDIRLWYDRVGSEQREELVKPITLVTKCLFSELGVPEPKAWSIIFNPLWRMSMKEQADVNKTQSEADINYTQHGIVTEQEIAMSRFGGSTYSLITTIDPDLRRGDDLEGDGDEDEEEDEEEQPGNGVTTLS